MQRLHLLPVNRVRVMDVKEAEEEISVDDDQSKREIVLVAVDASKKVADHALDWALANVVIHPGDRIVFQAIVPASSHGFSSSSTDSGWRFPSLGGECAAESSRAEKLEEIRRNCSVTMDKLRKVHDLKKVHTTLEILQFARKGVIPAEAKRARATWVVLDRNLKSEAKLCLQELSSNIVVVHRNRTKFLRLNLKRRGLPLDEEETIDSSSVLLNGFSLAVLSRGFDQLYWETSTSGSEPSSPDTRVSMPPKFEVPVLKRITEDRSSSLPLEVLEESSSSEDSQQPRMLCDFLHMRQSLGLTAEADQKQMHIAKHSPGPPPLCSICKHKTPAFGKPPRKFTFAELQVATGGFSDANFLAEGGYGSVHSGRLPDGQPVAVKQHKMVSTQGDKEFCAEIEVLSCAQQRNLVTLIGYCVEEKKRLLVYEFVCNGSLDSHLYGKRSKTVTLEWSARQKIALGAARALRYLHEECRVGCIVHRDMRPNNILLTHDFEPMVGDFGLARWQPDGELGVETRVIGAFGYLAPEYIQTGHVTEKADVYSFGVVLLELVSGRKAVDMSRKRGEVCLSEWAKPFLREQNYRNLIDQRLQGKFCANEAESMLQVAALCINPDPSGRPRMSQVLRLLEGDSFSDTSSYSSSGNLSTLSNDSPVSILPPSRRSISSRSGKNNPGSPLKPGATRALVKKYHSRPTQKETLN